MNLNLEQNQSRSRRYTAEAELTRNHFVEPRIEEETSHNQEAIFTRVYLHQLIPEARGHFSPTTKQFILGPSLSGKSHIAKWMKNLRDTPYESFFYYDLKTLNSITKDISYRELLLQYHDREGDVELMRNKPQSALVFLDGIHHLKGFEQLQDAHEANVYDWQATLSPPKIVYNIIKGNYRGLNTDIIVTSCKHFPLLFHDWRILHLRGFDDEAISDFVSRCLQYDANAAQKVRRFLQRHPFVLESCRMPFVCAHIIPKLARDGADLDTGLPLIISGLRSFLKQTCKDLSGPRLLTDDDVFPNFDESVSKLAGLACDTYINQEASPTLTSSTINEHNINETEMETGILQENWDSLAKSKPSYAFSNGVFMTILAALHVAHAWGQRELNALTDFEFLRRNVHLVQYIFGLLTDPSGQKVIIQINPELSVRKLKQRATKLINMIVKSFRSCCTCLEKSGCLCCKKTGSVKLSEQLKRYLLHVVKETHMVSVVDCKILKHKILNFDQVTTKGIHCGLPLSPLDCRQIAHYLKHSKKIRHIR